MRGFQELAEPPYHQTQRELDAYEMAFRRHQGGLLTRLIMPAVVRCVRAAARADALGELRRAAIAVTAYRLENGKFPDRIAQLVPDHLAGTPVDPFDGQPLRLKRDGKDVVLYSIGPDLREGGAPWDAAREQGDLVFRLRGR